MASGVINFGRAPKPEGIVYIEERYGPFDPINKVTMREYHVEYRDYNLTKDDHLSVNSWYAYNHERFWYLENAEIFAHALIKKYDAIIHHSKRFDENFVYVK